MRNKPSNEGIANLASRWLSRFLQFFPHFRGKKRLAQALFPSVFKMKDTCIVDRHGAVFHTPSMAEPIAQHVFIDGVYEPDTCDVMKLALNYGDTFFDIGANIGLFSSQGSRLVGCKGLVYAFEADPGIANLLKKNIQLNDHRNIRVVNAAVSEMDGGSVLFYKSTKDKFGMGSLSPQFEEKPISIESVSLDAFVKREHVSKVALIKVDVEGHEASVFRGARGLFESQSPIIIFEFCDWAEKRAGFQLGESQRVLLEQGFDLWLARDYLKGFVPLNKIITEGFFMLVANKRLASQV